MRSLDNTPEFRAMLVGRADVEEAAMQATAWNNGSRNSSGAGYGLRIAQEDRDRLFDRDWSNVVFELAGEVGRRPCCHRRSGAPAASCVVRRLVDGSGGTSWRRGLRGDRPRLR